MNGIVRPRVHLSGPIGLALLAASLALNSFLAVFGSLLWGFFWPAFMVYGLSTVYFGWWGVMLAVLSPFVAAFLSVGDAPFYLYVPVNLLQALAVAAAFAFFKIDPSLATTRDKAKYLILAVACPSFLGGSAAWLLRSLYPTAHDGPLLTFAASWTVENFLPAIIPGIWLHGVMADTYQSFSWQTGGRQKPWIRSALDVSSDQDLNKSVKF